ncbi:hypothetical protein [Actinophytocola sp. NPDC049390]|uniref:hypothetical protein n=1 Tax=Actinophytocola sp. NPDC049390 TaxID=3363894 RepID=UPI0037992710
MSAGLVVSHDGDRYAVPDDVRGVVTTRMVGDQGSRDAELRLAAHYGHAAMAAARRLYPDMLELLASTLELRWRSNSVGQHPRVNEAVVGELLLILLSAHARR